MDQNKISLYLNTIKYLKPIQIFLRLYYRLKPKYRNNSKIEIIDVNNIVWKDFIYNSKSYNPEINSFNFLNQEKIFENNNIDWNFSNFGKLWTYNLNYFDYLNQKNLKKEIGLKIIRKFISNCNIINDGNEPYPISIRSVNWIKFLSKNKIYDKKINSFLFRDCKYLYNNIEYHIQGNHLLENAFSLLFASYFFNNYKFFTKSRLLLISQLDDQILEDGAHFELSTMYHRIIFFRLLESINLIKHNNYFSDDIFLNFLTQKAGLMFSWINEMRFNFGNLPMVNDSANDIPYTVSKLFDYAKKVGVYNINVKLSESGYRKISKNNYELLIDVGNLGPDFLLAHGHSDTFNFEIYYRNNPIFVDTGTSSYHDLDIREIERDTQSHNTVKFGEFNQSEVWGKFRVARRAKVINLIEKDEEITAIHDGYKKFGFFHKRSFRWSGEHISIIDTFNRSTNNQAVAYFHLHSSINKPILKENFISLNGIGVKVFFKDYNDIQILNYNLSHGFNKRKSAYKIRVSFDEKLITNIFFNA